MNTTDTVIQKVRRTEKKSLMEVCSDGFALILKLRDTSEYGDPELLRQRILDLLGRIEHDAKEGGIESEDMREAIFALIAFLDETIIASGWIHKEVWLSKPLQLEFFNRFDAGEEFFNRLEKLRQRAHYHGELLEIYYFCMALGFKGKYSVVEREKLRAIIEGTYSDLRQLKKRTSDILSPHGDRKEEFIEVMTREVPIWVVLVTAFALGFFFYLAMTFLIGGAASRTLDLISRIV
jgi:type VI secretion system protein ImpK